MASWLQGRHVQAAAGRQERERHIFTKTKLCKFYARGQCTRGANCSFAHGKRELQAQPDFYKTELCYDYMKSGACKGGMDCRFAHSPQELRCASQCRPRGATAMPPTQTPGNASDISSSTRDVSVLCREIGMLHQQAQCLVVQLERLQQSQAAPPAAHPGPLAGASAQHLGGEEVPCQEEPPTTATGVPSKVDSSSKAGAGQPPEDDDVDFNDSGFSRMSTEEGGEVVVGFSRQTSMESDIWDDSELNSALTAGNCSESTPAAAPAISEEGLIIAEAAGWALVVRNTFINAEAIDSDGAATPRPRRARSVPTFVNKP